MSDGSSRTGLDLRGRLKAALRRGLEPLVREALEADSRSAQPVRPALDALASGLTDLEARMRRIDDLTRPLGPHGALTVREALGRFVGFRRSLERRHVTGCDACPASGEETLEEVAEAHGFRLSDWLEELAVPPGVPPTPPPDAGAAGGD